MSLLLIDFAEQTLSEEATNINYTRCPKVPVPPPPPTSARVRRVEDRLEGLEGRLLLLLHRRLERLQPDGEALDGIVGALLRARELRAVRGAEALLERGDALLGERRHLGWWVVRV